MIEKLIARLKDLGYTYDPVLDEGLLNFCLESVEEKIKNRINDSIIPEGLYYVEIDMICGEFLKMKKSMGQLDTTSVEQVAESIKEGDTTITFRSSDASPEQRFEAYINHLIDDHQEDFIRYRKMVW